MHRDLLSRSAAVLGFVILSSAAVGCGSDASTSTTLPPGSNPATQNYASSLGVNIASMTKLSDALYIQDLVTGTGTAATAGRVVSVTYTGWLANGTQFDSNVGKSAFSFTL